MKSMFAQITSIRSPDADVQRRGRNLIILVLVMLSVGLFFLPVIVFSSDAPAVLTITLGSLALYIGLLLLARCGHVTLAAMLFGGTGTLASLATIVTTKQVSVTPFYLLLVVLAAGLTLSSRQIWLMAAIVLLGLAATLSLLPNNAMADPLDSEVMPSAFVLLVVVTLMSVLGANSTNLALRLAQHASQEAETAALALKDANANLEVMVAERTASLTAALREVEQRELRLTQALAEVDLQRTTIREMSMPVIPVSPTTLVMPLVGAVDSTRLQLLQQQALQAIERRAAQTLILDITGVLIVDTEVALGLINMVQMNRLLGAETVLVGVRPEVAQMLVSLNLELQGMRTFSDLQAALGPLNQARWRHTTGLT